MPYFRGKGSETVGPVVQCLRKIGDRYEKTPAQVALRWLIEQGNVIPIPGAKNKRQAVTNAEALKFSLSTDEIEQLSQATNIPFTGTRG